MDNIENILKAVNALSKAVGDSDYTFKILLAMKSYGVITEECLNKVVQLNNKKALEMTNETQSTSKTLIKLPEVMEMTTMSKSSIYAYMARGEFVQLHKIGKRSVVWVKEEVQEWLNNRMTF